MTARRTARTKAAAAIALTATLAAGLAACTDGTVYDSYKPLGEWERADTASFRIPPAGATGTYATDVNIRTNGNYPFMALTIIVDRTVMATDTALAAAATTRSDTIDCRLADEKGSSTGSGLSNFQHTFRLPDTELRRGDSMVVSIRHNMMRETLPGIEDVGIKLTRK